MGGTSPPRLVPGKVPHFPHNATPIAHFSPLFHHNALQQAINPCKAPISRRRPDGAESPENCKRGCTSAICNATCACAPRKAYDPHVRSTARATPLASAPSPASTTTPASRRAGRAPAALAAVAAILLAALAGCGSSSPSGTSASPATVVPGSAPLYIDAAVRPEGTLKADANTSGRTLTGRQKPFEGLLKLLAGPTGKTPNYAHEIEPWLGPHAGIFLTAVDLSHAQGLLGGGSAREGPLGRAPRRGSGAAGRRRSAGGDRLRAPPRGRWFSIRPTPTPRDRSSKPRPTARARTRRATAASPTRCPPAAWPRGSCTASR